MKQTCILIPGMHRSGTSAISGVLNILGIYHGSELMPPASDNKKGFYENQLLYELNKKMLQAMGSNWEDVFFTEEKLKLLNETSQLEQLLQEEFRYSQYFTIKDPRLAYLFPIYGKALKNLDINLKVILPLRNPLEVAASLKARNGFSEEKSMLLWLHHFLLTERFSRGYPRVFTTFDQLVADPGCVLQAIDKHLGMDLATIYVDKKEQVKEFLTPGMKHHCIPRFNLSAQVPAEIRDIVSNFDKLNSYDYTKRFDKYYRGFVNNSSVFYHDEVLTSIKGFSEKTDECAAQQLVIESKQAELTETHNQLQQSRSDLDKIRLSLDEANENAKDLAQRLSASNESISKLDGEVTALRTTLHESEQLIADQKNTILEKREQVSGLELQLADSKTELVVRQQSILEQSQKISGLEAESVSYQQTIAEQNQQISRLEVEFAEYQQTIAEQSQQISGLEAESAKYQQTMAEQSQQIFGLETESAGYQRLIAEQEQQVSALAAEVTTLKKAVLDKKQLARRIEAELANYKKIIQEKDKQAARLEADKQRLGNELVGLYLSRSWRITRWVRILVRKLK